MSQHHPNQGAWNNFTYDAQNRLTSGYGLPYTYDSAGRMTSYENSGATAFRAHAVRDRYNSQWYYYEANGNMTSRWTAGGWQNLTWDHENHLSTVSGGGLPTESYLYDADGQRVKKISGGVATYYPNPYYEVSGSTITKYYYFYGQRVAMRTNAGGGWVHYDLHSDHLGSTVFVTAQTGATHSTEGYYAYGRTRTGGIPVTDQKFTGQKRDGTGLQYFNARYYDPELGQFISPDTLVPDPGNLFDYNRYMYTRGNPMKYTDPTGHCATLEGGAPDTQGDAECWGLAYSIYGYGLAGVNGFAQDWKVSPDQWLQNIATAGYATSEYLGTFNQRYSSAWRAAAGLSKYTPNAAPPAPSSIETFEKMYAEMLTLCARKVGGACGVSTGINGQAFILGARFSLDGYIDQNGNRMYYLTPALGVQISAKPLGVSGSNSYIYAPGASAL